MAGDERTGLARVPLFASFTGQGGVEKMLLNLARGLTGEGVAVHLVLARADGVWAERIPPGIGVERLGARHTYTAVAALAAFLRRERPPVMLVAKHRAIITALLARRLAGSDVKLVGRLGTNVSAALHGRGRLRRVAWHAAMRGFYRRLDGLVLVSRGVRDDVAAITGIDPARMRVIPNPVITPELRERAGAPAGHPWLDDKDGPVVAAMGRLTRQKDFPTLLRALAQVREGIPARLVILGDGPGRPGLLQLARDLGVAEALDLPGFQDNPYAFIARADLFVLSSLWEGSPNALTEAMALGTPVVSTDCPSGPAELLRGGAVAPLVPTGDPDALAGAMARELGRRRDPRDIRAAVAEYTIEASAARYLAFLRDVASAP